ncbi:phosphopantetheine-binding protein [Actinosynnema sp. NPDC053489]|uniref:phosphopantetheine-binding protein n=1 Tax=Actinosynnema sp. NPDC053489 TaxID=3363916 RepID=UPI0037CB8BDA
MSDHDEADLLEQVRQAWRDVLDVDDVGLDVDFLAAGGNSLLLVMLWEELDVLTTRELRVSDLFAHGTIRAQAALLSSTGDAEVPVAGADRRSALLGRTRRDEVVS